MATSVHFSSSLATDITMRMADLGQSKKKLKSDMGRVVFRLDRDADFKAAADYYGGEQKFLERFAVWFLGLTQIQRDHFVRKISVGSSILSSDGTEPGASGESGIDARSSTRPPNPKSKRGGKP